MQLMQKNSFQALRKVSRSLIYQEAARTLERASLGAKPFDPNDPNFAADTQKRQSLIDKTPTSSSYSAYESELVKWRNSSIRGDIPQSSGTCLGYFVQGAEREACQFAKAFLKDLRYTFAEAITWYLVNRGTPECYDALELHTIDETNTAYIGSMIAHGNIKEAFAAIGDGTFSAQSHVMSDPIRLFDRYWFRESIRKVGFISVLEAARVRPIFFSEYIAFLESMGDYLLSTGQLKAAADFYLKYQDSRNLGLHKLGNRIALRFLSQDDLKMVQKIVRSNAYHPGLTELVYHFLANKQVELAISTLLNIQPTNNDERKKKLLRLGMFAWTFHECGRQKRALEIAKQIIGQDDQERAFQQSLLLHIQQPVSQSINHITSTYEMLEPMRDLVPLDVFRNKKKRTIIDLCAMRFLLLEALDPAINIKPLELEANPHSQKPAGEKSLLISAFSRGLLWQQRTYYAIEYAMTTGQRAIKYIQKKLRDTGKTVEFKQAFNASQNPWIPSDFPENIVSCEHSQELAEFALHLVREGCIQDLFIEEAHDFMTVLGVDRCFEIGQNLPKHTYSLLLIPSCHRLIERGDVKKVQELFEKKDIPFLDNHVLYSLLLYGHVETAIKMVKRTELLLDRSQGLKTIADFLLTQGDLAKAQSCVEEIPDESVKKDAQDNMKQ
jgi:hypothetical protein